MAVNASRIRDLEKTDGQICHTTVPHGDSTVYFSIIGDRHLRYPENCEVPTLAARAAARAACLEAAVVVVPLL